jgi:hypothetical protein
MMEWSARRANRPWRRRLLSTAAGLRRQADNAERRYNERTAGKPPQRWRPRRPMNSTPAEVVAVITGRTSRPDGGNWSGRRVVEPIERPDNLADSLSTPTVWDVLAIDLPPPEPLVALVTTLDRAGAPSFTRSTRGSLAA